VDLSRRRRRTLSSVAPAVFALFALADLGLRLSNGSRWSILLLGVGSGVVNAASADSTGAVTCMVTGHLGRIARSLGDAVSGGEAVAPGSRRAAAESVRVVASFGAGATAALAAARRLPAAAGVLSGVGAVYAGLLYLHDRSAAGG